LYDFVIVDFPDPSSYNLGKLYTTAFYRLAAKHLSRAGLMVVQSTSPLFAPRSFWCIARTIADAGLRTYPYHVYVPSFGEWGFVLAGTRAYAPPTELPGDLRFLTPVTVAQLFDFPADMRPVAVQPNHLNNQVLVRYYEQEWNEINPYPWAAHYVPVPGKRATLVRRLFTELGVLHSDGSWDERFLCADPSERLFVHGEWQDGLEPVVGLTQRDRDEFRSFAAKMTEWRATG